MSHENTGTEKFQGNPKKSPEYLNWKNKIVNEYRDLGVDIIADEEYFILNLQDRNGKSYQIKIHAWNEVPVVRKNQQNVEGKMPTVPVTDIIEAEVLYSPTYSVEEAPLPTGELLDRLYAEKGKDLKK